MNKKLHDYIFSIKAVDAHEHLLPEQDRLSIVPDVVWLFHQYAISDLRSAGMSETDAQIINDLSVPLNKRWQIFRPFYEFIRQTGYTKAVLCAIKDLYGFNDLNDRTYVAISEEITRQNKPGITDCFLGKKGNIARILNCNYQYQQPVEYAHPIVNLNIISMTKAKNDLHELERRYKIKVDDLDSFLTMMARIYQDYCKHNVIGVKTTVSPPAQTIDKRQAAKYFSKFLRGAFLADDAKASLFSFLQDEAIKCASRADLTVAVHCGFLAGVNCDFTRTHVRYMVPLLLRHPEAHFDLFHLGYPWIEEAIAIAKSFSNASLNLCWCHAINPSAYERAIVEIINSVPSNKILAIGGDVWRLPDVAYGHLKLARTGMARAFSNCVSDGRISFDEVRALAERWLNTNAFTIYPKLKLYALKTRKKS